MASRPFWRRVWHLLDKFFIGGIVFAAVYAIADLALPAPATSSGSQKLIHQVVAIGIALGAAVAAAFLYAVATQWRIQRNEARTERDQLRTQIAALFNGVEGALVLVPEPISQRLAYDNGKTHGLEIRCEFVNDAEIPIDVAVALASVQIGDRIKLGTFDGNYYKLRPGFPHVWRIQVPVEDDPTTNPITGKLGIAVQYGSPDSLTWYQLGINRWFENRLRIDSINDTQWWAQPGDPLQDTLITIDRPECYPLGVAT